MSARLARLKRFVLLATTERLSLHAFVEYVRGREQTVAPEMEGGALVLRAGDRLSLVVPDLGGKTVRVAVRPVIDRIAGGTARVQLSARADGWSDTRALSLRSRTASGAVSLGVPKSVTGLVRIEIELRDEGRDVDAVVCSVMAWRWRRPHHVIAAGTHVLRVHGVMGTVRRLLARPDAPLEDRRYGRWVRRRAISRAEIERMWSALETAGCRPRISVVTPVCDTKPDLLAACIESVRTQIYTDWELCLADDASSDEGTRDVLQAAAARDSRIKLTRLERRSHIAAASNAALALATGDYVALLDHDDTLSPEALLAVAARLVQGDSLDVLYTDEDKLSLEGTRCDPFFKPCWSPELFLSSMYICHLMVLRRSLVGVLGGFRSGFDGAQDYDLVLRAMSRGARIMHLPRILYHWRKTEGSAALHPLAKPWAHAAARRSLEDHLRRQETDGEVLPGAAPGLFRVRYRIRGSPLVSILIPTRGGPASALLDRCLRALVERTAYRRYEVLVISAREVPAAVRDRLAGVHHTMVTSLAPSFNFSSCVNELARRASGDHFVLLNDDVEVVGEEWLSAMLEYSQQPAIGAVGARLVYPDGRLQHAGVATGVSGIASHVHYRSPGSSMGYAGAAVTVRNCAAVTAACLMTSRETFQTLGGFNEHLALDLNDVDYCLRARAAGFRIVFTPYAELVHHESTSSGPRQQDVRAVAYMRSTWGDTLLHDPYYNPNLSRTTADYRLDV
jgi:GT2 family glycosyltransferase